MQNKGATEEKHLPRSVLFAQVSEGYEPNDQKIMD